MNNFNCVYVLQTRLSMARERMNTLVRADAERCREVNELQVNVIRHALIGFSSHALLTKGSRLVT